MANYPTYYPNNQMPMYQAPMYNQQMQPNLQPQQYQQNMFPTQMTGTSQQFQQMPNGINGKVVPAVENITANDVPMDGSVAFFPRQDMSEIYAKSWNADGTIRTIVFKPVLDGNPNNIPQTEEKLKIEDFNTILEGISGKVDNVLIEISKIIEQPKQSSRTKKETNTE